MYSIRVEPARRRLAVTCSERLTSEEALRAIAQAALLLEADRLQHIVCDVRRVERGPGKSLLLAAAIATRLLPGQRIAFVTDSGQERAVRRVIRFSGRQDAMRSFATEEDAGEWLTGSTRDHIDLARTPGGRHLEAAVRVPEATPRKRRPASRATG